MRIFTVRCLNEWKQKHQSAGPSLDRWYQMTKRNIWKNHAEMKATFPTCDVVTPRSKALKDDLKGDLRVVFNIAHNDFRLIAHVNLTFGAVYLKAFFTHKEYDGKSLERDLFRVSCE